MDDEDTKQKIDNDNIIGDHDDDEHDDCFNRFVSALERHGGRFGESYARVQLEEQSSTSNHNRGPVQQSAETTWELMATDLGCSVDDVKSFAYEYLIALESVDRKPILLNNDPSTSSVINDDHRDRSRNTTELPSIHEMLMQYNPHDHVATSSGQDKMENIHETSTKAAAQTNVVRWRKDEILLFQTLLCRFGRPCKEEFKSISSTTRWNKIAEFMPMKSASDCQSFYENNYTQI